MIITSNQERVQGPDILRVVAFTLLFMWHYPRVNHQILGGGIGNITWVGVDLFFVLSGYFIGSQLFKSLKSNQFSLYVFSIKRTFKILPNFYFILLLVFLFPGIDGHTKLPELWKFLTFTQNYNFSGDVFSQAWSLCVDAQFYLLLPLIALLLSKKATPLTSVSIILTLLLGSIILRYTAWNQIISSGSENVRNDFFVNIYFPTHTRLDGIVVGVGLSLIKVFQPQVWRQLLNRSGSLLTIGLILLSMLYVFCQSVASFNTAVFGFTLSALGNGFLVAGSLGTTSPLNQKKIPLIATLSIWSYAFYLIHIIMTHSVTTLLKSLELNPYTYFAIALSYLSSLVAAAMMFKLIEEPFLKLRDLIISRHTAASK